MLPIRKSNRGDSYGVSAECHLVPCGASWYLTSRSSSQRWQRMPPPLGREGRGIPWPPFSARSRWTCWHGGCTTRSPRRGGCPRQSYGRPGGWVPEIPYLGERLLPPLGPAVDQPAWSVEGRRDTTNWKNPIQRGRG